MEENRRGFLKTLGKLATAVGLVSAAATLPVKAKIDTTLKATEKPVMYASNVCVTNRKLFFDYDLKPRSIGMSKLVAATSQYQERLNRITMARIDNISMTLKPEILLKDFSG